MDYELPKDETIIMPQLHGLPIAHLSSLWLIFKLTIIAWYASKHLQAFQCSLIAAFAASSQ